MRNVILAVAFFVCVPAWAQTALPPQWGTSSNAAPTAKGKAGETKKPLKLKPGQGTVTPPGQEVPPPVQPATPANSVPAQPVSAPVQPPFIPPPQPVAAPVPTPSPPAAAAAPLRSTPPHKTAAAKATPAAPKKKAANADLLTPAKPKSAAPIPGASAAPAPVGAPSAGTAAPSSAATSTPQPIAASSPAPTYVAPPIMPPPVTNYSSPAVPPMATASAPPGPAPAPYQPPARTYTVPPVAATPIPTNAAGEPLPGARVPALPPAARAPEPLPSLVASSPRNRRKAAARDAAQAAISASTGLIDISAPLSIGVTPTYPGTAPLTMKFDYDMERGAPLDLSEFSMSMHTGTHIDAPLHFIRGAPAIDQVPLEQLNGPALVINVDPAVSAITAADLERYPWRGARRILLRTRNSVNEWIVDPQFHPDYVFLAPDAAELLANGGVELVGIDYLSIEQFGAPPRTHVILLSKGIAIVEGLDLRSVDAGEYDLTLLPLKILGHEAAPARAVLRRR